MELLRLKERIKIATELGESHFREFKSGHEGPTGSKIARPIKKICQDISKTLVAFANADGGALLVGVEDDGSITGLPHANDKLSMILEAPKNYVLSTTPLPTTKASIVDYEGFKIAYFSIPKGTEYVHITSDGKCLKRRDLESIPISPQVIQIERNEKKSREYDRIFVDGADINDLDIELLKNTANEYSKTIGAEKFLQHLELAEFDGIKLRLRQAALLLFAKDSQRWHPRNQVRILKINGTELKTGKEFNVINDETASDNILNLIESSWDLLRPHLTETKFSDSALFKAQSVYPELACREALINAIAHRDYSIEGRGIEIFIFSDRLEVKSPGMLLSSINLDDLRALKGVHQSRNVNIARVLREVGYMRELGEGMRRIYELMKNNDLIQPELKSSDKSFNVTLYQKLIYTTEEKLWLENFNSLDLTREEKTIVRLGAKGELIAPKMIWESVGIVDTDVYRQLLESLKKKRVLHSEVSRINANNIAKRKGIKDKKSIPRFRILKPMDISKIKNISDKTTVEKKESPINEDNFEELDSSDYAKIFIENIPFNVTEGEIFELFEKYGEIESIQIPRNFKTNSSRGFAFIEFESKSAVKQALDDKYNIYLKTRKIIVKKYLVKK